MSRSRKKSPTHKKSNKALKQFYNRRLRRKGLSIEMGNFGWYKKANDSWELHDYIIRSEEYTEKDAQGYIDWKIKARNSLLEEYNRFNDCDWVKLNRPVRPYEQEIHRSYEGRLKTNWGLDLNFYLSSTNLNHTIFGLGMDLVSTKRVMKMTLIDLELDILSFMRVV